MSRSGEIAKPLITASSPVFTTAVIEAGSTTLASPVRKRAAPTPPHSTVDRSLVHHGASQAGDRFAVHVARPPSCRCRRAQLPGRRRHDRLRGVARPPSTYPVAWSSSTTAPATARCERIAETGVELIVNERNLGFAAGNNVGHRAAARRRPRVRVGAQQRHDGRAGDAAGDARRRRCRPLGRRRRLGDLRHGCSRARPDVGRRSARTVERPDPRRPQRWRPRRLPHGGVAAAARRCPARRRLVRHPLLLHVGGRRPVHPAGRRRAGAWRSPPTRGCGTAGAAPSSRWPRAAWRSMPPGSWCTCAPTPGCRC